MGAIGSATADPPCYPRNSRATPATVIAAPECHAPAEAACPEHQAAEQQGRERIARHQRRDDGDGAARQGRVDERGRTGR